MAGRRTNLALLWTSVLALVTGVIAFGVGTRSGWWVTIAHGVLALAIVLLLPWKSVIAGRGVRRSRPGRLFSLLLTVFLLGVVASGLVVASGAADAWGPFTLVQLHVSFGLAMVSMVLVHTLQRPVPHRVIDFSRRNALRAGGLLGAAGLAWLAVEGLLDVAGARGGNRRFSGSHEITDPDAIPATQWINDRVQHLDRQSHGVWVGGVVLSVDDLVGSDSLNATLDCTGGWYTTQDWEGTSLGRLIRPDEGSSIVVRSVTGYWRRFPISHAQDLLLATHVAGSPLLDGNGGPVRLVAPDRRGYWWVKWVDRVEIDDNPPWWQPPLPTA